MINKTRSIYARKFDSASSKWVDNATTNMALLRYLESTYNELLKARGYVFLRDVYEALGIPIDYRSIVVGWFYDSGNAFADNFIDFSIEHIDSTSDFWLDFNVDGIIMDHFD